MWRKSGKRKRMRKRRWWLGVGVGGIREEVNEVETDVRGSASKLQ